MVVDFIYIGHLQVFEHFTDCLVDPGSEIVFLPDRPDDDLLGLYAITHGHPWQVVRRYRVPNFFKYLEVVRLPEWDDAEPDFRIGRQSDVIAHGLPEPHPVKPVLPDLLFGIRQFGSSPR